MSRTVYRYRMSRAQVALRLAIGCVVAWLWLGLALRLGVSPEAEGVRWGAAGLGVVTAILLAVALWNLLHPGTFEAIVSTDRLIVRYPGETTLSFDVAIDDISHIELRTQGSYAGSRDARHYVVLRDGQRLLLTSNYWNSVGRIHRALRSVRPGIEYRRVVLHPRG